MIRDELLELLKSDEEVKELIKHIIQDDESGKNNKDCKEKDKEIEMLKEMIEKFKNLLSKKEETENELYNKIAQKDEELQNILSIKNQLKQEIEKLEQEKKQKGTVKIGDTFDTHKYINANTLIPSGDIKEILLYGWINTKTDKIIKKSVVRL